MILPDERIGRVTDELLIFVIFVTVKTNAKNVRQPSFVFHLEFSDVTLRHDVVAGEKVPPPTNHTLIIFDCHEIFWNFSIHFQEFIFDLIVRHSQNKFFNANGVSSIEVEVSSFETAPKQWIASAVLHNKCWKNFGTVEYAKIFANEFSIRPPSESFQFGLTMQPVFGWMNG